MSLFGNEVRREFIARPDAAKGQILYKWPDLNIRKWTQLTVEQDELAVFFRDGQVQGTVQPGRATLDSSEIPFLGKLVDAASGGNLFRTELYFISTREFPNLPFGGAIDNVVDPETGIAVGLRVFGDYSLKVTEPQSLILQLVGTQNLQTNDQITDWMREQLLKVLRTDVVSHITGQGWPILGVAARGAIQVRCGNCNALNPETAKFCASCGNALTAPAPPPAGAVVKCPNCQSDVAANAKFCPSCGHNMQEGQAPPAPPAPPSQ